LGLVLAVPAWWLASAARSYAAGHDREARALAGLNGWLAIALLAMGLHNAPLAAPGVLNLAYQLHSRRAVGWAIVTIALAANAALLVGSLVFLASGRSFEQFQGID
jgi:uncharacterized membrane protein